MSNITDCIKVYLHNFGVWINIYVDDSLNGHKDFLVAKVQAMFYSFLAQCLGFKINVTKSVMNPTKDIVYLGFRINTETMKFICPEYKINHIKTLINGFVISCDNQENIPARDLASYLGLLNHINTSHGNFTRVITRFAQHELGVAVVARGWDTNLKISNDVRDELLLCLKYLDILNGQPIFLKDKIVKTFNPVECEILVKDNDPFETEKELKIFVSDASDSCSFIYEANSNNFSKTFVHSVTESEESSSFRELLALYKLIKFHPDIFLEFNGNSVLWITDSQVFSCWMRIGSKRKNVQRMLLDILKFSLNHDIQFKTIWQPRESNIIQLADRGSKACSSDDWGISKGDFDYTIKQLKVTPTIDAMATSLSAKCKKFYSFVPMQNTFGVDFFVQDLISTEIYWITPPIKLISRTLYKILNCDENITCLISVPVWKKRNYWFQLFDGMFFRPFVKDYFLNNPKYVSQQNKGMFQGYKHFKHITLLIESKGNFEVKFEKY